jgi:hypothetical protein
MENEELEDFGELDFLEDGEATIIGLLMVVAEQLGVKIRLTGGVIEYDEEAPEKDKEIIEQLAKRLKIK